MNDGDEKQPGRDGADPARRDLLKTLGIGGVGAGLAAVVGGPAVLFVTYPLDHDTVSGGDGFLPVGRSDQFADGVPVKVDVLADRRDAWNRVVQVKVGSAWVLRDGGVLRAYSTVCPHLGCAVDIDDEAHKFKCPCHRSAFTFAGAVEGGPSPRGMDSLEVQETGGLVALRYQRFRQGVAAKEVI
ncbi:MAG: Rieske 2Fe-2S domain-containing protein [Deltaproteobacteria bacterium]|nr:Rieske 2Fe-2S domain-containing protein [Deltaproteobacteria bacterium]